MKTPNEKQIGQLKAIISNYQDCTFLLVSALNDYAESVGVKDFTLCCSYSATDSAVCYLEYSNEYTGSLFEAQGAQAISAFLGMIQQAQAQATKEQHQ